MPTRPELSGTMGEAVVGRPVSHRMLILEAIFTPLDLTPSL